MVQSGINRRIISLDRVRQNHIVYVNLNKAPEESVFTPEYRKAARIIHDIIKRSGEEQNEWRTRCGDCKGRDCSACRFRNSSSCSDDGSKRIRKTRFQTAVPFIGDRGTGKTSVMCSILECLRGYDKNDENAAFYLETDIGDPKFIVFDMLDANALRQSDDVIEIILARMLSYLEDLSPDGDFRELYRQIDELHEDLCLVRSDKKSRREEYGLAGLQHVADSQKVAENFQKLVNDFLLTVGKEKFHNRQCYLVIALDDIDMYRGSEKDAADAQFALLEHVYHHMRIPGLIVLMTYNEIVLKKVCNRHFAQIYGGKNVMLSKEDLANVESLTGQFLSKLFPQEQRIYLPDFELINAYDQPSLYVRPVLEDRGTVKYIEPFDSAKEITVKEFMLRMIAHRTGVYFDAAGRKKHFFEPRNLREIGELFQVIYSMERIKKDKAGNETSDAAQIRSWNRQELLKYLYNQFALRHLSPEEYEQFHNLSMLPLDRQNKDLVNVIRAQQEEELPSYPRIRSLSRTIKNDRDYNYGELLYNLYRSTRFGSVVFRKEYVYCILGTRSVLMNEIFCNADSHETVQSLVGASIAGSWANHMLPPFVDLDHDKKYSAGAFNLTVKDFFNWKIPAAVQNEIFIILGNKSNVEKEGTEIQSFLKALILAGMFFARFPEKGLGISLDMPEDSQAPAELRMCSESIEHIDFNVLNFVINLNNNLLPAKRKEWKGYLAYIREKLRKLGEKLADDLVKDWGTEEKDWAEKVKERDALKIQKSVLEDLLTKEDSRAYLKSRAERAKKWKKLMDDHSIEYAGMLSESRRLRFLAQWDTILDKAVGDFAREIRCWQHTYGLYSFVLPVQHFDIMYNITKRVADKSYYDLPEDAHVLTLLDYYNLLYKRIGEELKKQDEAYCNAELDSFFNAFKDCVFCKMIMAKQGDENYNPYIESILVSMIWSAGCVQIAGNDSFGMF